MEKIDVNEIADAFQIALINSIPKGRVKFDWAGFKPQNVKSADDLPPYLIFGPLDQGTLVINRDGWSAQWTDPKQNAKLVVSWSQKTHMYTANQYWQGEEGSAVVQKDTVPLIQVIALLYETGFPKNWDAKAKAESEKLYHLTWIESNERLSTVFAAPDGVFRVLMFPIMVKNIRNAKTILEHIAEQGLTYGFFATARLMQQDVYYEIGKAPAWTAGVSDVMVQSIGETGFLPTNIPQNETIEGKEYMHLERDVMMLCIEVPFAGIFDFLARVAETPMPVIASKDEPLRREMLPIIVPQKIEEKLSALTLEDYDQGIRVAYTYIAENLDLDVLLKNDAEKQIEKLEKLSDQLIDQLSADVSNEMQEPQK